MTDLLERSLNQSQRIMDDVATKLNVLKVPDLSESKRLQLSCALFKLAIDHSQAIVVLVDKECNSSALALQRPCFEAFTRGMWLKWCATDPEINKVLEKDEFPEMWKLVEKIEANEEFQLEALKCVKEKAWSHWCSLTHGGMGQIVDQWSKNGIGSNHDPVQIQQALYSANLWYLLSATQLAITAGEESLIQYFQDLVEVIPYKLPIRTFMSP